MRGFPEFFKPRDAQQVHHLSARRPGQRRRRVDQLALRHQAEETDHLQCGAGEIRHYMAGDFAIAPSTAGRRHRRAANRCRCNRPISIGRSFARIEEPCGSKHAVDIGIAERPDVISGRLLVVLSKRRPNPVEEIRLKLRSAVRRKLDDLRQRGKFAREVGSEGVVEFGCQPLFSSANTLFSQPACAVDKPRRIMPLACRVTRCRSSKAASSG